MLKVGIVGTGRVAKARIREISQREDIKVVAISSSNIDRAKELAEPISAAAYDDYRAITEDNAVDAVMVCNHNAFHAKVSKEALLAGKHVSVDYPLALNLQDAYDLILLSENVGKVLHVEHIELLSAWFTALQKVIPKIGELVSISWTSLSTRQAGLVDDTGYSDWTFSFNAGFSMFMHAAILSRLIKIAGMPIWVDAHEQLWGIEQERYKGRLTSLQIGFETAVVAQVLDGTGLAVPVNLFSVVGKRGLVSAENQKKVSLSLPDGSSEIEIERGQGLFAQDIENFISEVANSKPSYAPLEHVFAVMRLADAAEKAFKEQKRVRILSV